MEITAQNAIYLGEETGGKGRQFKARFLVPGLVKYDYGVCLLTKENADKFIQGFTGCPVVINHQNVTDDNVKDVAVGYIFSVWFDNNDGYYWCNGILRDKEAIKLINEGYSVSCQYAITEYSDNTAGALHNGNPYDKIIENGKPEHLAIVNNPRYEGAIIAVNAINTTSLPSGENTNSTSASEVRIVSEGLNDSTIDKLNPSPENLTFDKSQVDFLPSPDGRGDIQTATNSFIDQFKDTLYTVLAEGIYNRLLAVNGWITTDKVDDEGNPIRVYIEGYHGESREEKNRKAEILRNFKKGDETKYDFTHTRAKLNDTQKQHIKNTINNIYTRYTGKPLAQVEVRSLGGGALGLCTSGTEASVLGLDSSLFSGKYTQESWEKSIKDGFHPKTDNKEMVTCVLTHELGHAISVNNGDKEFWNKIDSIRSEYLKNVEKKETKHPDFISDYARANKYEFVAEAFAQGQLSKNYGKYTKQVMELMEEQFAKNKQLKIAATNKSDDDKENVIIWEEDFGAGYPIDEESYNKAKEEQKED